MLMKTNHFFQLGFILGLASCGILASVSHQAHAEQSALEAKLQRRVNQLSTQLEATSTPSASLREEVIVLMRDGAALFDVPFNELNYQGKLQNGNRALVALANAYTQKTKDPLMDNGPEGFLKLISEQNVFHPEKIEYIGLAARAYPHLGGSSGLQIANLVSRLLFEKAIETTPYESKHLDEALLLLNSAYPLADGRDGTKDYYQTLFLTLSSLNHEESLKALTVSLRSQQAKDPEHFGWVEGFLSSLEASLEETLKEALYQKEEIDLALRSIHEMNSGCTKEETEETEETAEALEPSENFLKDRQLGILKEELRSDNSHLRLRALRALAQFEASKVLEILEGGELFKELQDTFKLLDDASAMHICIALLQKNSTRKKEVAEVLASFGEKAAPIVPALVNTLKSPEADVRLRAVHILGQIGEKAAPAIPALIEVLKDPNKAVRLEVAKTLSLFEEKAAPAIPTLIEALKDPDKGVRWRVLETLSILGEKAPTVIPALIEALRDPDEDVRSNVAWILGKIGEKAAPAVPALTEALRDPDEDVRRQVATALRSLDEKADLTIPALIEALKDPDEGVRWQVFGTLSILGEKAAPAIPILVKALRDPDKDVRRKVVIILGRNREKATQIIPAFIEALRDPDHYVRLEVAKVLGWFGEEAAPAIPALIEALRDPDKDVRLQVVTSLGYFEERSWFGEKADLVIPALIEALKDSDRDVRGQVAATLGSFREKAAPAIPALIEALRDPGEYVRWQVSTTLGEIGEKAAPAIPALTQIIFQEGEDSDVKRRAIDVLTNIGPNALPVLHATFHTHPDPKIRVQAGEAISQILENLKAGQ